MLFVCKAYVMFVRYLFSGDRMDLMVDQLLLVGASFEQSNGNVY